jgi:SAM-dependent methyltransferase
MVMTRQRIAMIGRCTMGVQVSTRKIASYFHVDPEIVSFIPELLADFDELGSFPETIVALLRDAWSTDETGCVLDLGCGFGAVTRAIAREFQCQVTGVDMLEAFVAEADRRAKAAGLGHLCHFRCDDIRNFLASDHSFDVALLLSVGDALGPMDETVGRMRRAVRPNGCMVIDDGFALDDEPRTFPGYEYLETRERLITQLTSHGDELIREVTVPLDEVREQNRIYTERIAGRVRRLSAEHPEHREAFERYLDREREECALLENHVVCATWLIGKRAESMDLRRPT